MYTIFYVDFFCEAREVPQNVVTVLFLKSDIMNTKPTIKSYDCELCGLGFLALLSVNCTFSQKMNTKMLNRQLKIVNMEIAILYSSEQNRSESFGILVYLKGSRSFNVTRHHVNWLWSSLVFELRRDFSDDTYS